MITRTLVLLATLLLFSFCNNKNTFDLKTVDLAIENVNIFDSEKKKILKNKTILINNDEIVAIIKAKKKFKAIKTIQGNGRLITSGFIDTHVHLRQMLDLSNGVPPVKIDDSYRKKLAEKCLTYGTTTVIDMGTPEAWMDIALDWQKNPSPDFPNNYLVGGAIISDLKWNRNAAKHHVVVRNSKEATQKVQTYANKGIEYLKLYWKLEEKDMKAVIKEANNQNIKLHAHVDQNIVTIPQAMDLGVLDFEHFFTITPSILNYDFHWDKMNEKFGIPKGGNIDDFSAAMTFFFKYINEDIELETRLKQLFKKMAKEKATISTALHVLAATAGKADFFSSFNHFPIRTSAELPKFSTELKKELHAAFDIMMQYVKMAHDTGVKIRIGTDNREAGQSMLSEMILFAEAGFFIEDILQIATWNGAVAMELEDKFGSIKVGKKADFVLFEQSPFDDAQNFLSKKTVIKGGKEFQPQPNVLTTVLGKIENKNIEAGVNWIKNNKVEAYELVEVAYHFFNTEKIKEGQAIANLTKEMFPKFNAVYNEDILNWLGYKYLSDDKVETAIAIFKVNTEAFPNSANAYDSLGEGYLEVGKKDLAINCFIKSVELNPENENGIRMLEQLKSR